MYKLSKIIPVFMRTRYGLIQDGGYSVNYKASWIQYRGRVFAHKVTAA